MSEDKAHVAKTPSHLNIQEPFKGHGHLSQPSADVGGGLVVGVKLRRSVHTVWADFAARPQRPPANIDGVNLFDPAKNVRGPCRSCVGHDDARNKHLYEFACSF